MSAAFEVHDVEQLLAMMERWAIAELHLTVGDAAIDLLRNSVSAPVYSEEQPLPVVHYEQVVPAAEILAAHTIAASLVGIFHLAARAFPHGKPLIGDTVQIGQVIGALESMHVLTELCSPICGVIIALPAEDGTGVEYGQPLLVIQPFEENDDYENIC